MCGRYYIDLYTIRKVTRNKKIDFPVSDIYPGQFPLVLNKDLKCMQMEWGMAAFGKRIINAREETVDQKPFFKEDWQKRKCVIPAKGFYEWDPHSNKYYFYTDDILYMAGIYNEKNQFVILKTKANDSIKEIHNRMPWILKEEELKNWFNQNTKMNVSDSIELKSICPYKQETLF